MLPINIISVFVAAATAFVIGFLLHGPVAGKLWMQLANIHPTGNEKFSGMIPQLIWNFVTNLATAYALAVMYLFAASSSYLGGPGVRSGVIVAVLVWAGFLVTSSSIEVIWMGRTVKHWLFEVVSSFIVMVAMGIIIAIW